MEAPRGGLSREMYDQMYKNGETFWNTLKLPIYHKFSEYIERLVAGDKQSLKVFFPLCGDAQEMKDVYNMGHTVVGVDWSDAGLRSFFEKYNLEFHTEHSTELNGTFHESEDKRIRLYCCDISKFTRMVEGQFDAIWDFGSIFCVEKSAVPAYCEIMKTLMTPGCIYILCTVEHNNTPPVPANSLPLDTLKTFFGENYMYEELMSEDFKQHYQACLSQLEAVEDKTKGPMAQQGGSDLVDKEGPGKDIMILKKMCQLDYLWGTFVQITAK